MAYKIRALFPIVLNENFNETDAIRRFAYQKQRRTYTDAHYRQISKQILSNTVDGLVIDTIIKCENAPIWPYPT